MAYIGGDPEAFVVSRDAKKIPFPAHLFFKSSAELDKVRPFSPYDPYIPSKTVFRDGFAVEFNFPPSHCRETMAASFLNGVISAQATIGPKHGLLFSSAIPVDHSASDSWPKDVRVGGCTSSMNAYYMADPPPEDLSSLPFRAAGGHFHISWPREQAQTIFNSEKKGYESKPARPEPPVDLLVKLCDAFVGVPFTYIFQDRKEIFLRRTVYGRAGEYRVKSPTYFEYRVLGAEAWSRVPFISMFAGILRQVITKRFELAAAWNEKWEHPIREAIDIGGGLKEVAGGLTVPRFYNLAVLERMRRFARYSKLRQPFIRGDQSSFNGFDVLSQKALRFPTIPTGSWELFGKVAA